MRRPNCAKPSVNAILLGYFQKKTYANSSAKMSMIPLW